MKRVMHAGPQRAAPVHSVLGALLLVFAVAFVAGGQTVRDQLIAGIIGAPDTMFEAMHAFVESADALFETDPDAYAERLANPDAWFEAEYGITLKNASVWTIDLTFEPPTDGALWLFESPYVGDGTLQDQGLFFSGPGLAMMLRVVGDDEASDAEPAGSYTQQFLEIISSRSEDALATMRTVTLRANLPGDNLERQAILEQPRETFYSAGVTLSAASTELLVIDLAVGVEYGAVHFGEILEGQVRAPNGFVVFGEHSAVAYNATI